MTHEPRLPCPSCGYELGGIFREDSTARCPECGNTTDLRGVQQEIDRRAHAWKTPALVLALFIGLLLVSSVSIHVPKPGLRALEIVFGAGLAVAAYVIALRWLSLPTSGNLLFAAGAAGCAFMTESRTVFGLLLISWLAGFWIYGFLRNWRGMRNRL